MTMLVSKFCFRLISAEASLSKIWKDYYKLPHGRWLCSGQGWSTGSTCHSRGEPNRQREHNWPPSTSGSLLPWLQISHSKQSHLDSFCYIRFWCNQPRVSITKNIFSSIIKSNNTSKSDKTKTDCLCLYSLSNLLSW